MGCVYCILGVDARKQESKVDDGASKTLPCPLTFPAELN